MKIEILNINFFFSLIKNFINFSCFYVKIDLNIFVKFSQLLKFKKFHVIILNSKKEKLLNKLNFNSLVIEGQVSKKTVSQKFELLNISEFVFSKQKEIYLNNKKRKIFILNQNLVLHKKFIFEINNHLKLDKIIYNYFLKIKNLGNFFFIQYRIFGLGFKIKKSSLQNIRSLRFEIGFGHSIYYPFPNDIKCLRRKRRFFIFGYNLTRINYIKKHINKFKLLNPYKIRGLKDLKYQIKMKKGKKQSKK